MVAKIQIVQESICPDTFDDTKLPTDVHIITFTKNGERQFDAVRAYTKVDIFDAYYDKLKGIGTIHSIESGYGRIKPKLYGNIKTKQDEHN
ncbi:MAG: hypothetical protein JRE18_09890 [Deltaproteobacteria bacterium]|jgi:hypothetical protein|nr:hypothetical protein [Deltaproteobacteria bacterium]